VNLSPVPLSTIILISSTADRVSRMSRWMLVRHWLSLKINKHVPVKHDNAKTMIPTTVATFIFESSSNSLNFLSVFFSFFRIYFCTIVF